VTLIATILLQFSLLSLLAFGGANAVLPEIQRIVVETNHWVSSTEFTRLFAIAQATPGPNVIIVTLIGWHMAGIAGALAATLAICGPAGCLIFVFMHFWEKFRGSRWREIIQLGVAPLAVGLVLASGFVIAGSADETVWAYLLTAVTVLLTTLYKFNPIWMIAAGALIGLTGIV
jgi:chromate transporter